ncbi:MAG: hypothetical protein HQ494_08540 [Rhodospirillales bacterium]|nr:hypothetical protein [Rhodospirillales bacterium]
MTGTGNLATGLPFVQMLIVIVGAGFAALGLILWAMESGSEHGSGNRRQRLAGGWRQLSEAPWSATPRRVNGWLVDTIDGLVRSGFEEADKGIAFGGFVMVLLFIILPVLALINMLIGGSAFLFWYYLALLAALAFLNFSGESERLKVLNGLAAVFLGLSLIAIIPVYALRAFTEVSIHNVFSHAVLKSPLIAVLWYLAAYGAGLVMDMAVRFAGGDFRTWPFGRFVHGGLAAMPVAFVLTFAALLAGHLAVFDQNPARSWTLILLSTGTTALSLPAIVRVMGLSRGENSEGLGVSWALGLGFALSTILSLAVAYGMHFDAGGALSWSGAVNVLVGLSPNGERIFLGPDFWVMHLPFLPWLAFVFTIVAGLLAKAIAGGFKMISRVGLSGDAEVRPFLASALLAVGFVAIFWSFAVLI